MRKTGVMTVFSIACAAALAAAVSVSTAGAAVVSANPTVIRNGEFSSVAAASSTDVWAVGSTWNGVTGQANLAEHWNGKTWTRVSVPLPFAVNVYPVGGLKSVAVFSGSDAWAIGLIEGYKSQAVHWNGRTWAQVPLPVLRIGSAAYPDYILSAVGIASASSAWAVGYVTTGSGQTLALILHWNGKAWTRMPVPASADSQELLSATVISPDNAWAVGSDTPVPGSSETFPLTLHWNGRSWARVSAPVPADVLFTDASEGLAAVAGSPSSGLWAVGYFNQGVPYVIRWNGKKWVSSPVPPRPTYPSSSAPVVPNAVAVLSASSAWMAGSGYPAQFEHWNGKKWSMLPVDDGLDGLVVEGLAGSSASDVWAVGETTTEIAGLDEPVSAIFRWNGKTWTRAS